MAPSCALLGRHAAIRAVDIAESLARDAQRSFALIKEGVMERDKDRVLFDVQLCWDMYK